MNGDILAGALRLSLPGLSSTFCVVSWRDGQEVTKPRPFTAVCCNFTSVMFVSISTHVYERDFLFSVNAAWKCSLQHGTSLRLLTFIRIFAASCFENLVFVGCDVRQNVVGPHNTVRFCACSWAVVVSSARCDVPVACVEALDFVHQYYWHLRLNWMAYWYLAFLESPFLLSLHKYFFRFNP